MRRLSYIPYLLLLLLLACGNSRNNEIEEVLTMRENALETKDVGLYLTLISPDYNEERDGKTLGLRHLEKNFKDTYPIFNTLNITNTDRSIYLKGSRAEVFQINRVEATINDEKSVFKINEKIALEKIGDKWLIVKESDADYFTGYAFGNIE